MSMYLYVFEEVLIDYSDGMIIAAAHSESEAIELVEREFYRGAAIGEEDREEDWKWFMQEFCPGLYNGPVAVYPLAVEMEPGVKNYVRGGG